MTKIDEVLEDLKRYPATWVVTGVAGFIGSNLLETLLQHNQRVIGLDNFETGKRENLELVRSVVTRAQWLRFSFHEGSILDSDLCEKVVISADFVLHQAALGSVPRSLRDPVATNNTNIGGFLNMILASSNASVRRFVYAASSSTYGDHEALPKVEDRIGKPLSPYAVTKFANELYADVFNRCYNLDTVGLRYFNVFGPRQDPNGAYAAVIPCWYRAIISSQEVFINGDGSTSRDFCFVDNVVQANILAATSENALAVNQIYNTAVGDRTTLNELFYYIKDRVISAKDVKGRHIEPSYRDFREGDVMHSQADISKIRALLGYEPRYKIEAGLDLATKYYMETFSS